jgi:isocitrate dehydrogenase (NAD+)
LVAGANFGIECSIFEAVHGSAPDIAGKDMANPTAVLRSAVLMLHHLGEHDTALHIDAALGHVYTEKKHVTRDVGGKAGTTEFADAVIEALQTIPVPAPVAREAEL